ncbi:MULTISPECIES: alanine--glyoxylate aminotransferase family protein [Vibrio]|jgi:alanine-glyoxylate transaminase/serine-glyoxylate transaminase/serine-pyruvate transaminase|uniref:Alanine--glyoxylate aminotransferase n=1 Tax=Vibrio tasmaniensis TaxID=212663 RepID=A0A2N7NKC8_9VIBR|nr:MULTISPECIES: alanine--glyoxylate aminotransferase family protein [Vibrio]EAQ52541.1 aminotransferase, class V [Vibrio sp. MED222]PMP15404.1 alanine--glyoxylate aminotransferase [Vibrio tasmaniensis]TKG31946.1 alanine--glyoxylate aminotransferase family protein [Vibrio tasmaniensis]TKG41862.1 alanine--glyoxylate aminotransferase family protein [Vibrio tasmaniensis]TKG45842.1 alanine--glyoxylate aminotransferase family protein [Vibrio tasmaniensis]
MSNLTLTAAIDSFYPPHRTLMGPGPSDISPQVLQALSRPTIGHLDPLFIAMMDELKQLLKYAFQTENEFTIAVSAPGSAGMETCFVNLIEPGEKVIVCRNGVFGERMRENVVRCGGEAILVDDEWGKPVSVEKVEKALAENPDAVAVAFVHAETSTGALSDAQAISAVARQFDALSIVDAVTSLGGVPLLVDEWQLDAVYSGSQKCLSCVPGLSPVTFSQRAVDKMKARQAPVQSWFLDQSLVLGYWSGEGKRSYHHTAPVNSLYALHESLVLLKNEGLDNAWSRHYAMHQELKAGVEALGLEFVVAEESRLPQLNALYFPEGIDEAKIRTQLLEEYNLEIGAGLGSLAGKAWRIGLMGYGARKENVALCLKALQDILK